ncbi:putative alpha/beta hydrolase [Microcystis aeruginosa NIES-3804]|uniref:Putative alpha/beta hydrolase n=1 Tax=Microcystis aeruginosa NIES-3804 TaxID=2517783 RepID=A0A6H9GZG8_MICAE|nr:alpha/beta fold hydrolase [Microcystis aeruginosa]GCL51642.1 putative alpha/beta hydrolase [Microcystis aeruginosa NIES-3804]
MIAHPRTKTDNLTYTPPPLLKNGFAMTLYVSLKARETWQNTIAIPEPVYEETIFTGANAVPIYGIVSIPPQAKGTIIGTYGITGDLDNQWFLRILGRKAVARDYAVVLFDWRAHGKTAELSPTLTSDGIYEGLDFLHIAAQAQKMGCPAPFWFTGYSLGGQLALWGIKSAENREALGIDPVAIGGGAVICPNLDSNRSLSYLVQDPWGKHLEKAIARELRKLAKRIHKAHPDHIDPEAITRATTIAGFDRELVIKKLGFETVYDYYAASSPLPFQPYLTKPTFILYAADDPLFSPAVIPDLQVAIADNPHVDLLLTNYGGHVGYISSLSCQRQWGDSDRWWAWNRVLDWFDQKTGK